MFECIIFDLDGVIVSTDHLHYQAWKVIADQEGILFNEEINNQLRGISRMESLEIILKSSNKKYSDDEKELLASQKNKIYGESLNQLSYQDVLPGIFELLEKLKNHNLKIAIGSSSKNAKKILEKINLTHMFDAISDGTNISRSKPDPEVFIKAAEMVGVDCKKCIVVEDAMSGVEAAKACGMLAVAVGDAKSSPLKDYDIEDLEKILKI